MRVEFISQPHTPPGQWLGNQLRSLLVEAHGRFNRFTASVAYAKFSGISRIYEALQTFRQNGGRSSVAVGIGQRGTSRQGLQLLRQLVDQVYVYHDTSTSPDRTFHPKTYIFEETNQRAVAIIGSGNLTAGGLFTNYEAHLRIELNLTPAANEDRILFAELLAYCNLNQDPSSPCVLPLSDQNMALLADSLPDEVRARAEDAAEDEAGRPPGAGSAIFTRLFGTVQRPGAPPPDIHLDRRGRPRRSRRQATRPAEPPILVTPPTLPGFWKVLSPYDVSPTSSPGQIVIPIQFRGFFPPQQLTQGPDAGGRGRQWEVSFPVGFRDGAFIAQAPGARFIVYEPKTGHPRPNTECRFTFHEGGIFSRLEHEDILLFRPTPTGPVRFEIERIRRGTQRHATLYLGGRTRWGTIS